MIPATAPIWSEIVRTIASEYKFVVQAWQMSKTVVS